MPTYLLCWNPDRWPWLEFARFISEARAREYLFSIRERGIGIPSRPYLPSSADRDRGIVGSDYAATGWSRQTPSSEHRNPSPSAFGCRLTRSPYGRRGRSSWSRFSRLPIRVYSLQSCPKANSPPIFPSIRKNSRNPRRFQWVRKGANP